MAKKKKKSGADTEFVAQATLKHARISARKARLMVEMIKGMQVEPALQALRFNPRKSAQLTRKLLESAIANATEAGNADVDSLWITGGYVNMGRTMKRFQPRAQGRAFPIRKKSSHITIQLGER